MANRGFDWRIVAVALAIQCLYEYALATMPRFLEVPLGPHGPELFPPGWRGLVFIVPGWLEIPSWLIAGRISNRLLSEAIRFQVGWISVAFVLSLSVRLFHRLPWVKPSPR